jgi:hypothetical protein
MSAGRRIETYLTVRQAGPAFIVTKHAVVQDLHPTKGWRTVAHHKESQSRDRQPSKAEIEANKASLFEARK